MKKLLSVLALSAIMSSVLSAADTTGLIERLVVQSTGQITVGIGGVNKIIEADTDAKKEMYATLLTAQTSGKTVQIKYAAGIISTVVIYTAAP